MGRYRTPGCCPGTRAGWRPGPDCSGGFPMAPREVRRIEARQVRAEIAGEMTDCRDTLDAAGAGDTLDPLPGPSGIRTG